MASNSRSHGKLTPEFRTLRYNLPDINNVIAGDASILHWYADTLFAAKMISNSEVVEGRIRIANASQFSNSVLSQVEVASEKFYKFVQILEEQETLSTVVKKLQYHVGEFWYLWVTTYTLPSS